jgi:hypothetical protein
VFSANRLGGNSLPIENMAKNLASKELREKGKSHHIG